MRLGEPTRVSAKVGFVAIPCPFFPISQRSARASRSLGRKKFKVRITLRGASAVLASDTFPAVMSSTPTADDRGRSRRTRGAESGRPSKAATAESVAVRARKKCAQLTLRPERGFFFSVFFRFFFSAGQSRGTVVTGLEDKKMSTCRKKRALCDKGPPV